MATTTANYNLTKPDPNDFYDIGVFNSNADKIDAALAAKANTTDVNNALSQKAGLAVATQSANGLMSSADKGKLDGIEAEIATKANTAEANAKVYTDAVQVGGRNLLVNSNSIIMTGTDYSSSTVLSPNKISIISDGPTNCYTSIQTNLGDKFSDLISTVGNTVTVSCEIKTTNLTKTGLTLCPRFWHNPTTDSSMIVVGNIKPNLNGVWQKVYTTISVNTPNVSKEALVILAGDNVGYNGVIIEYRNWKLEVGNKATDWTPAPEDFDNKVMNATKFNGTNTIVSDFKGKVAGSTVENPNYIKQNGGSNITGIFTPDTMPHQHDNYSDVYSLDGLTLAIDTLYSGVQPQTLFAFDLISIIERKYGTIPASDTAGKVAWLKANVNKLTCNWWGYGSSPKGNKGYMYWWQSIGLTYAGAAGTVASASPSLATYSESGSDYIKNRIDSNGFFYVLVCTDASDGTTASTIYTDYVNVEVTLNTPFASNNNRIGTLEGQLGGKSVGNANGNIALNNGIINANLNADMLDSKHATDFPQNGTIPANGDLNKITQSGMYRINATPVNAPPTSDWGQLIVAHGAYDTMAQVVLGSDMYWRVGNPPEVGGVGALSSWRKIWHDGNDGSGSGLDADTVDGKHASDFAPSGYGLGSTCTLINGETLFKVRPTGFYYGKNLIDAPNSDTGWWTIQCFQFNPDECIQYATQVSPASYATYKRYIYGGTMTATAWKQLATTDMIGSKKASTLVIGTSTAGHTTAMCDYLCDGTDDQIEFNNAISALSSQGGGKILVLDGTYKIDVHNASNYINVNVSNIEIQGMGRSTNISTFDGPPYHYYAMDINANNCIISDIQFSGIVGGINIFGSNNIIDKCFFNGGGGGQFRLSGGATANIISNCQFQSGTWGVQIDSVAAFNTISNCLLVQYSQSGFSVSGNNNSITGNVLSCNSSAASIVLSGSNNIASGNILCGKDITDSGTGNLYSGLNKYISA